MPWCNQCKSEYVKDVTICPTCNLPLTDELTLSSHVAVLKASEDIINKLIEYLKYSNIESYSEYDEEDSLWVAYVNENDSKEAFKHIKIFCADIDEKYAASNEGEDSSIKESFIKTKTTNTYVKKDEKYKDLQSSAYSLLLVGVIGLIVLVLNIIGVIDFNLESTGKYIIYLTMGILFIVFIVMGIHSLNSSKIISKEAEVEKELESNIHDWFNKNVTTDMLDDNVSKDDSNEIIYFKRCEVMKELLIGQFGEIEETHLDKLVDDIYNDLYDI